MGNAATIVNRSIFSPRNPASKDFQAVVPVPPNQPPPSFDKNSRKSSRKQKAVGASVAPIQTFEDFSKNASPQSSTHPTPAALANLPSTPTTANNTSNSSERSDFGDRSVTYRGDQPTDTPTFAYTESQMRREGMQDCEFECSQITKFLFLGGQR
eukprot:gene39445-48024_t